LQLREWKSKVRNHQLDLETLKVPLLDFHSGRGSVLIVTMWIVLVLAGLVLVFSRSMRVEAIATANHISSSQADAIAQGAVQFIRARLNEEDETLKLEGETPYEMIPVGEGYFWLLRPNLEDHRAYYYGIRDEAAKVNLNSATEEMLLKLPEMTSELAAAIIDWRDSDSDVEPGGAETEYYLLLDEPYNCKNSDFETVEEVLFCKRASHEFLYGEDMNRNGVLDDNENDGDESEPYDNQDGNLDRGFFDYVTVYSKEPNVSADGADRFNVKTARYLEVMNFLRENFSEQRISALTIIPTARYDNIIDFYFQSGLTPDEFKQIEDKITSEEGDELVGLININTASREVLMCLPELTEADVAALMDKRVSSETDTDSIVWITDVLDETKCIAIGEHITARSFQYSADIISVSGDGRAYRRYKAVFDTQDGEFNTLYWRSYTPLGWPLDPEIITTLRAGGSLDRF
jgi:type II secretory pathway component PulK